jgi:hypothetical protein
MFQQLKNINQSCLIGMEQIASFAHESMLVKHLYQINYTTSISLTWDKKTHLNINLF